MQYQKNTAQTSLKRLALVVWFTSLFLPGFHSAYGAEAWGHWTGWTLLTIIPFAFLQPPSCLALYSNFFFWLALMRKDGLISLSIMWMMALTITFHTQIMINESPTFAPVVAWGWGAVLWLLSYIILTLSRTVRNHPKPASRIYTTGFVCCLIITALAGLNIYQYQRMNDDERQHLLPFGMVFTTQKISGIKIQPFPENLYLYDDTNIIIENAVPDLKIIKDSNLKNSENPLPNAKPGYYYTILNSHSDSIIIARPGNAPDYRYQIVPTSPQHFLIKLSYGNGTPIWQQEYRTDMPLYYHKRH